MLTTQYPNGLIITTDESGFLTISHVDNPTIVLTPVQLDVSNEDLAAPDIAFALVEYTDHDLADLALLRTYGF